MSKTDHSQAKRSTPVIPSNPCHHLTHPITPDSVRYPLDLSSLSVDYQLASQPETKDLAFPVPAPPETKTRSPGQRSSGDPSDREGKGERERERERERGRERERKVCGDFTNAPECVHAEVLMHWERHDRTACGQTTAEYKMRRRTHDRTSDETKEMLTGQEQNASEVLTFRLHTYTSKSTEDGKWCDLSQWWRNLTTL